MFKSTKAIVLYLAMAGFAAAQDVRLISSSHQDIAWMDSPEACREYRDTRCITPALEMMAKDPAYCFVMENMLNLMEYLERHPERRAEIERLTREGRLEWGATFNQPYESLLSGEQLVRETYFGRRWLRENFPGGDARVYFNPDVPGRALQMQQILSKAGIPYMIISRYHEGFYRYGSPDGSSVIAYSPGHYTNASSILEAEPAAGVKALGEKLAHWAPYFKKRGLPAVFPLLHSVDFSRPTDFGPLIRAWNDGPGRRPAAQGPALAYSSARRFFEDLDRPGAAFDEISGERPNLWLYIHGPTHHRAITAQRESAVLLPAAEIFATARALVEGGFSSYPGKELDEAWLAAITPDHGWGGKEGQVTDRLFLKKYEFARDAGRRLLRQAVEAIAGRVAAARDRGVPVVLFNSLSWERTLPVTVNVPSARSNWQVVDGQGRQMPAQFLPARAADGLRLEFIARGVPPLGYKTFYLVPSETEGLPLEGSPQTTLYENDFYRVELAPGGIKSLVDKSLRRGLLKTDKFLGFEVFTMRSVGNGAGEFGRVQQPTMEGFDRLGRHGCEWRYDAGESGALRAVFTLEQALPNGVVRQKLVIYNHDRRIDCEVRLDGWDGDPYREFRLAVPVDVPGGRVAYEVPLAVVEVGKDELPGTGGAAYGPLVYDEEISKIRPREVQNFLDASGPDFGVTLTTSVAVNDYLDPTPGPAPYPVLQPVLLASRRSCHGQGNWYLQEGDHHFRFSLTSHPGGWTGAWRRGLDPNTPFIAVVDPDRADRADLPESRSFFSLPAANGLITTVKKCADDDSVIVRFCEIEGRTVDTEIRTSFPLARAEAVDILEQHPRPLPLDGQALKTRLGHHAIETIKLQPAAKARD